MYYVREEDAQKSEKVQRERGFGHKRVIKVYFDGKGLK